MHGSELRAGVLQPSGDASATSYSANQWHHRPCVAEISGLLSSCLPMSLLDRKSDTGVRLKTVEIFLTFDLPHSNSPQCCHQVQCVSPRERPSTPAKSQRHHQDLIE